MSEEYKFGLNIYREIPTGIGRLEDLVDWARERLNLFEIIKTKPSLDVLKASLTNSPLGSLLQSETSSEAEKIDFISHWILRVAYSEKKHEIFIQSELSWFKIRFKNLTNDSQSQFMENNGFRYLPLTVQEMSSLDLAHNTIWYKLKWTDVRRLVASRQYLVKDGAIYIPHRKIVVYFLQKIEDILKDSLDHCKKMLKSNCSDQLRTILILIGLQDPKRSGTSKYPVALSEVDKVSARFPLCMKHQHETLRKTHHLKYFSRMEYGLFLKGLGLSLEESLQFWREEFSQTMPEAQFLRKYSYLFKHQYGTVGGKIDQKPYTCQKIVGQLVLPGQVNGCPFKNWDEVILRRRLEDDGVSVNRIREIVRMKGEGRFGEACARYMNALHGTNKMDAVIYPISYYDEVCERDIEDLVLEGVFGPDSDYE